MWIHRELRVGFIAHPRTGSREVGDILERRGFKRWLGHHGVPWSPDYPRHGRHDPEGELWWWFNEPVLEWTFYATHRNHFETIHSISRAVLGGKPVTPQRLVEYLWKHPGLYRARTCLFPGFFEVAGCRELCFDHLRDDVALLLMDWRLAPLRADEGHREDSEHWTRAKPRGEHYSEFLSPEVRAWIEANYGHEMARYGYVWQEMPGSADDAPPGEDVAIAAGSAAIAEDPTLR